MNEIWKVFRQCGPINCVELKHKVPTGHYDCGFIHFLSERAADLAFDLSEVVKVMGRPVIVLRLSRLKKVVYRHDKYMCKDDWKFKKQTEKRALKENNDKPSKKFKNNLGESVARNVNKYLTSS